MHGHFKPWVKKGRLPLLAGIEPRMPPLFEGDASSLQKPAKSTKAPVVLGNRLRIPRGSGGKGT